MAPHRSVEYRSVSKPLRLYMEYVLPSAKVSRHFRAVNVRNRSIDIWQLHTRNNKLSADENKFNAHHQLWNWAPNQTVRWHHPNFLLRWSYSTMTWKQKPIFCPCPCEADRRVFEVRSHSTTQEKVTQYEGKTYYRWSEAERISQWNTIVRIINNH